MTILLAMDRATVRRRDANGYLHVEISNISKANVCPYYGREIPDAQALGLEPDRIYQLYRDPEELARGAHTFNNLPLLNQHLPVNPDLWDDEIPNEAKIGSLGTDAGFAHPYLQNSLVVWSGRYQQAIEDDEQRELSCGYRYRADMTPGRTADGLCFDGVMREIIGNHVALVIEGRAGPDVVIGDEVMKLKSRTALMISGALAAVIRPKLAADAKVDISDALAGVDAKSLAMDGAPKTLAAKVMKLVKPHLAADQSLDADGVALAISAVHPLALDEDKIDDEEKQAEDEDEDDKEKQAEDEDPDAKEDDDLAEDEDDDDDKKPAMDSAAVRKLVAQGEKRAARRVAAIGVAQREVAPHVGEVLGMDSAEAIYKFALDQADVDTKGVHPSAYRAMVKMLPQSGAPTIAQDQALVAGQSKLAAIVGPLPTMIRS